MKVPTVLDTVYLPPTNTENPALAAYLKLSFGGFRSHEYVTHVYHIHNYDWDASEIILDAEATGYAKDITVNATIESEGHQILGTVKSKRGGISDAKIELLYMSPDCLTSGESTKFQNLRVHDLFKGTPIYPILTGTYTNPNAHLKTIEFELTKHGGMSSSSLVPMDGYVVRGRVFANFSVGGKPTIQVLHALNTYEDFLYNFYRGELAFPHIPEMSECKRTPTGLDCDTGEYTLVKEDMPFINSVVQSSSAFTITPFPQVYDSHDPVTSDTLTADITGTEYKGYLHFEERDVVRPFGVAVNVTGPPVKGDKTIGQRIITVSPRLYDQDINITGTWQRFVPFDVDPIQITSAKKQTHYLQGPHGTVFQIMHWTKETIHGVFYSGTFGRVGTFAAFINADPSHFKKITFPVPGTFLSPPKKNASGDYGWTQFQLNLEWVTNPGGVPAPHNIGGNLLGFWNRVDLVQRNILANVKLMDVRYDPFTGVMGADLHDMGNRSSLFAKLKDEEVVMSVRDDGLLSAQIDSFHRLITLSKNQRYGEITPLDERQFGGGKIVAYLPVDAILYVDGKRVNYPDAVIRRELHFPAGAAPDREISYKIAAKFKTGRVVETTVRFKPQDWVDKPLVVNFYKLQ